MLNRLDENCRHIFRIGDALEEFRLDIRECIIRRVLGTDAMRPPVRVWIRRVKHSRQ